jgi:2'-5' RNA ligase
MVRIAGELWFAPFELTLDLLTGSERSLALCPSKKPSGLMLLQLQLQKALAFSGIRRPGWRFSPHVTLLYRNGIPFSRPIAPISWWVDELVLVHSHVGLKRHDIAGRWPLLPRGSAPMAA